MTDYRNQLSSAFQLPSMGHVPRDAGGPLGPGGGAHPAPSAQAAPHPEPAPDFVRTVAAGGALPELLLHPTFLPFENLFRRLPEEAMFNASPDRPYKFELGAFEVPKNQALLLADFRFALHRLSGAAASDTVPMEPERLSMLLAFDLTIANNRKAQLRMEIDPVTIQAQKEAFQSQVSGGTIFPGARTGGSALSPANNLQYALSRFAQSVVPGGLGLSGLPNRPRRLGAEDLPFTMVAVETQRVQASCVVFRPIPIPIAFFQCDISGVLMSMNTMRALFDAVKPAVERGGIR
jgi:hypothetical protein